MRLALLSVLGALLLAVPGANAAVRYAAPNGFSGGPCSGDAACTLKFAVEGAADGDEVVVRAGTYALASGQEASTPTTNLTVHGETPGSVHITAPGTAINLYGSGNTALRDMQIGVSSGMAAHAATIERVDASTQSNPAGGACRARRVLDTICVNRSGLAVEVDAPSALVRNATAIGTTYGLRISGGGGEVYNTIARGAGSADVYLNASGATVSLHHSDFADTGTLDASSSFDFGSGNISAEPSFVNSAGGDYHEQPSSPTADHGSATDGLDLDGDLRTLSSATDMGADEAVAPPLASLGAAESVSTDRATFSGQANTGALDADYWFEYAPEGHVPLQTATRSLPARPNLAAVSTQLDGLQPSTTYVVTLRVRTGAGTATSAEQRFTTAAAGGPGTGGSDTEPPVLGALQLTRSVFAVGGPLTAIAAAKRGTTLSFRVSEAGTAAIAVQRARAGRRRGGKCVAPSKAKRKAKRCTRYSTLFTLKRKTRIGRNSVAFSGRVGISGLSRRLSPGKHRFRVVAADAAGNKSEAATRGFRIVKR